MSKHHTEDYKITAVKYYLEHKTYIGNSYIINIYFCGIINFFKPKG